MKNFQVVTVMIMSAACVLIGCVPKRIEVVDPARVGYQLKREPLARWKDVRVFDTQSAPDGLHFAGVISRGGGKQAVLVDGEQLGGEYDQIADVCFSETGTHVAYAAKKNGKWLLVVDGKPQDERFDEMGMAFNTGPYSWRMWYATLIEESRGRLAHIVYVGRKGASWHVVLDGKVGTGFEGELRQQPVLSADGQHVFYTVWQPPTDYSAAREYPFIDGVPVEECTRVLRAGGDAATGSRLEFLTAHKDGSVDRLTFTPITTTPAEKP